MKYPNISILLFLLLARTVFSETLPPESDEEEELPRYIHVSLTVFDVSRDVARQTFEATAMVADHSVAMRGLLKAKGETVSLVKQSRIPVLSGNIGKIILTKKFDYPEISWAKDGTSFEITQEKKEFGTILEVEPVFSTLENYIWLDYKLSHTPYMPKIKDVKISLPEKRGLKPKVISAYNREFCSSLVIRDKASLMIGSFMIVDASANYRLFFLTVHLPDPKVKQSDADQPAAAADSKTDGKKKAKSKSEVHPE